MKSITALLQIVTIIPLLFSVSAHHAGGKRRAASSARRRQGLRAGGGCWTAGAAEGGGLRHTQVAVHPFCSYPAPRSGSYGHRSDCARVRNGSTCRL
jgi:hypothetical protein